MFILNKTRCLDFNIVIIISILHLCNLFDIKEPDKYSSMDITQAQI